MGEKDKTGEGEEKPTKRIDVSFAQVAGSAVAAVIAAMLAGRMGVYGTFLGAGVVSVVATTGGPVFQHFFRRTGEQIKDKTVQVQPRVRQITVQQRGPDGDMTTVMTTITTDTDTDTDTDPAGAGPADQETTVLPRAVPAAGGVQPDDRTRQLRVAPPSAKDTGRTQLIASSDVTQLLKQAEDPARTRQFTPAGDSGVSRDGGHSGGDSGDEYTYATTHGTKWRGWKRTLIPAALTFVLAVGGLTLYEVISGSNVSGNGNGTSIGQVFHSGGGAGDSGDADGSGDSDGTGDGQDTEPTPQPGQSDGNPATDQDGSTAGTDDTGGTPDPGTGGQDPGTGTDGSDGSSQEPAPTPSTPGTSPDPGTGDDTGDTGTGDDGSGSDGSGADDGGSAGQDAEQQATPSTG